MIASDVVVGSRVPLLPGRKALFLSVPLVKGKNVCPWWLCVFIKLRMSAGEDN